MDARDVLAHAAPFARVQPGAGFWLGWLAAALLLLDSLRGTRKVWQVAAWSTALAAIVAASVSSVIVWLFKRQLFRAAAPRPSTT